MKPETTVKPETEVKSGTTKISGREGNQSAQSPATSTGYSTPCVRQCCLDEHDVCLGCHRTLAQIKQWSQLTEAERQAIMATLPPPAPSWR